MSYSTYSKGARVAKNKKKNRRRKDQSKNSSDSLNKESRQEEASISARSCEGRGNYAPSPSRASRIQDVCDGKFVPRDAFEDIDIDDELDPAVKEELDREVEDFARRLNSDWPERMQEILSLSQERRTTPFSTNANVSLKRHTGLSRR